MDEQVLRFGVLAQKVGSSRPLYMHGLTFERLMDDVIVPYDQKQPFFIDGVPVTRETLERIKVVRQGTSFDHYFRKLHEMAQAPSSAAFVRAEDYPTRLDVVFRAHTEDVTAQMVQAYTRGVLPGIKDYVKKRPELLKVAFGIFTEGMKLGA